MSGVGFRTTRAGAKQLEMEEQLSKLLGMMETQAKRQEELAERQQKQQVEQAQRQEELAELQQKQQVELIERLRGTARQQAEQLESLTEEYRGRLEWLQDGSRRLRSWWRLFRETCTL